MRNGAAVVSLGLDRYYNCYRSNYCNLNNSIQLVLKYAIGFFNLAQRETMRDERSSINLSLLNQSKNFLAITSIHATGLEGEVLATRFAIVQVFPCFEYIGESFFWDGIIYLWRNHRFYKIGQALFQLINNSASLVFESIRSSITTKFCLR